MARARRVQGPVIAKTLFYLSRRQREPDAVSVRRLRFACLKSQVARLPLSATPWPRMLIEEAIALDK
jgi:hypothetical protein